MLRGKELTLIDLSDKLLALENEEVCSVGLIQYNCLYDRASNLLTLHPNNDNVLIYIML